MAAPKKRGRGGRRTSGARGTAKRLSLTELAFCAGAPAEAVAALVEYELLECSGGAEAPCFDPCVVPRVRRIVRLREELDLDWGVVPLVAGLLDRIAELEQRVAELES